jgi:hypothetical protein
MYSGLSNLELLVQFEILRQRSHSCSVAPKVVFGGQQYEEIAAVEEVYQASVVIVLESWIRQLREQIFQVLAGKSGVLDLREVVVRLAPPHPTSIASWVREGNTPKPAIRQILSFFSDLNSPIY